MSILDRVIERQGKFIYKLCLILDMKTKKSVSVSRFMLLSLSVTGKSGKGLEMRHQEVKSCSLPGLPSTVGEVPVVPVPHDS